MTEFDPHPPFQDYAEPGRLVSAPWLSARLGIKGLRVIEVDADSLLYDIGHIPTATRINVETELMNQDNRDVIDAEGFARVMRDKGIRREDTLVIYGDKGNWWAAFALWVFELYGHPDVRLLDGGRDAWMSEERDTSYMVPAHPESDYPVVERSEEAHRVFVRDLLEPQEGRVIIDARSPEDFSSTADSMTAERRSMSIGTCMRGHIPGAQNVPWDRAVYPNGNFRSLSELQDNYAELDAHSETVLYSHLGAQAAHTWFVLKFLLGFDNIRVYDGSWAEWGNMVRMPVEH